MVVSGCFKGELDYEILQDISYYRPHSSTSWQQGELTPQTLACKKRKLDLFLPKVEPTVVSKCPVIVFVPGGSWRRGDRKAYRHYLSIFDTNLLVALILAFYDLYWNIGKAFAKKGVACAVISYRLSRPQLPWLLIESFCSLAMSIIVVLFSLMSLGAIMSFLNTRNQFFWIYRLLGFDGTTLETFYFFVLISLDVVYFIVFWNACREFISYTHKNIFLLLSAFAISFSILVAFNLVLEASAAFISIFFMLQMLFLFGAILYSHNDTMISHPDHIWDISFGVKWVKEYGERTKKFDARKLFLCGHSAGGHLVSLLALDTKFLETLGMHRRDIKGVITISGVYNLHRLAGGILEGLVLRPAFGSRPETWSKASPRFCLSQYEKNTQTGDGMGKIPFLVLNAERDFQLLEDADEFVKGLKRLNFDCSHYVIRGKNHFSVVSSFGDSRPQFFYDCNVSGGVVCCMDDMCLKFIRKLSQR